MCLDIRTYVTYVGMYVHTNLPNTYVNTYVNKYVQYLNVCMCTYIHTYVNKYVQYLNVCMCTYVHTYIHMYTHSGEIESENGNYVLERFSGGCHYSTEENDCATDQCDLMDAGNNLFKCCCQSTLCNMEPLVLNTTISQVTTPSPSTYVQV